MANKQITCSIRAKHGLPAELLFFLINKRMFRTAKIISRLFGECPLLYTKQDLGKWNKGEVTIRETFGKILRDGTYNN